MNKKITTILVLLLTTVGFSQKINKNLDVKDQARLSEISDVNFNKLKYQVDVARAKSMNLPLKMTLEDGNVAEFQRFNDDVPIYYRTYNSQSAVMMGASKLYMNGGLGLNLSGSNVIIAVWDQNHPQMSHSDYHSRIQIIDGSAVAVSSHSTHVTGTILSSGASSPNLRGRGISFRANGWVFDWTNDISEMRMYSGLGLNISNHSYGYVYNQLPLWYFGAYNNDSRDVDLVINDNTNYLPIFAAGNDRDSYQALNPTKNGNDLITGKGAAKNNLTVAAVYGYDLYTSPAVVRAAPFTNYGPTDDFRIKPDISAKGMSVYSTYYNTASSTTAYAELNGTSMASPGVTGAMGLVQEYWDTNINGDQAITGSLLKGLALHNATEAGPSDGPDHMFGWGVMNVSGMVETLKPNSTRSFWKLNTLNNNQVYTTYVLANGDEPLKVSISWNDPAGATQSNASQLDLSTPRLVNDLDVRVSKDDNVYTPWYLQKDFLNPIALKGDNNVDPFERVDISNPQGVYKITVSHKNNLQRNASQVYGLVLTGGTEHTLGTNDVTVSGDVLKLWVSPMNKSELNIVFDSSNSSQVSSVIYDMSGRLVQSNNLDKNNSKLDVSGLQNGIYIINVKLSNGSVISKKFTLNR